MVLKPYVSFGTKPHTFFCSQMQLCPFLFTHVAHFSTESHRTWNLVIGVQKYETLLFPSGAPATFFEGFSWMVVVNRNRLFRDTSKSIFLWPKE